MTTQPVNIKREDIRATNDWLKSVTCHCESYVTVELTATGLKLYFDSGDSIFRNEARKLFGGRK